MRRAARRRGVGLACMLAASWARAQQYGPTHATAHGARGTCPAGMLAIPAGAFWMGSPDGEGVADEHPRHRVTVAAFCMDRTEVTVGLYRRCVTTGLCRAAPTAVNYEGASHALLDPLCNAGRNDREDHPINCVDWFVAAAYCRAQGARLPTEPEWEYAARGTDGRRYPWGNEAPGPDRLNACDSQCVAFWQAHGQGASSMHPGNDGYAVTAPVGTFPAGASPFGLLDMAGNVWEWTADGVVRYGPRRPPTVGPYRVYRGGGWSDTTATWARATSRIWDVPSHAAAFLGFRCARSPGG